jgi:hypothetical protein
MRKVKPGDTVAVELSARQQSAQGKLVRQPLRNMFFTGRFAGAGHRGDAAHAGLRLHARRGCVRFGRAGADDAEARAVLRTETGLLVVRAPDDSRLKLEDGDVIVDIDGRTPSSPRSAAHPVVVSAGEKLKLNILRTKKRMSFEVTVPEDTLRESALRTGSACEPRAIEALRTAPGPPGVRGRGAGPGDAAGAAVAG